MNTEKQSLQFALKDYGLLSDGWDGIGSKAPLAEAVATAVGFVERLPSGTPLPKPMLSPSGEVGLYWDIGAIYADVTFAGGGAFSLFSRNRQADVETFIEGRLSEISAGQLGSLLSPLA